MPYIEKEFIEEARKMDLLTYLRTYEPGELVKITPAVYTTVTHSSLKISNGKWYWWARNIGGRNALDYLIKVRGMNFIDAVESILGNINVKEPVYESKQAFSDTKELVLPELNDRTYKVRKYLEGRNIDREIVSYCIENGLIAESLPYHNVVFLGYDDEKNVRYAAYRATNETRYMGDCKGSSKEYSFRLIGSESDKLHVFESSIDLLSYATICKKRGGDWKELNLLSLGGVYLPSKENEPMKLPPALKNYLSKVDTKTIYLHLDNDTVGRAATKALTESLSGRYEVVDAPPPLGKDFNDYLSEMNKRNKNNKYIERGIL